MEYITNMRIQYGTAFGDTEQRTIRYNGADDSEWTSKEENG